MSNQKTRYEKLYGYWVINSIGDNTVHTAKSCDPVTKILEIKML